MSFHSHMSDLVHLNKRSLFSYPPPVFEPTAREIAQSKTIISTNNSSENIIDCPEEVHCTLPDGLIVKSHPTAYGQCNWGIYATKIFPQHSLIFITKPYTYIHDKDTNFKLIIDPEGRYSTIIETFFHLKLSMFRSSVGTKYYSTYKHLCRRCT